MTFYIIFIILLKIQICCFYIQSLLKQNFDEESVQLYRYVYTYVDVHLIKETSIL